MLDEKLSLVLPAHNEAENIEPVIQRVLSVLPNVVRDAEIIIVDDGSDDGTGEFADELAARHLQVQVIHHDVNLGYGSALRSGFEAATGDLIMFMDSDRQFDIGDITALLPYVPHYDVVAGYRIRRRDPLYRRVYAKVFDFAVWVFFGIHMRDVDCAFKIYRADLIKAMPLTMPGALINTEMLAFARRMGASLVEVGVSHYPRTAGQQSGGSPRVVLRAMGETMRLWWWLRKAELPELREPVRGTGARTRIAPLAAITGAALVAIAVLILRRRR